LNARLLSAQIAAENHPSRHHPPPEREIGTAKTDARGHRLTRARVGDGSTHDVDFVCPVPPRGNINTWLYLTRINRAGLGIEFREHQSWPTESSTKGKLAMP
jgi:hypothetical protein